MSANEITPSIGIRAFLEHYAAARVDHSLALRRLGAFLDEWQRLGSFKGAEASLGPAHPSAATADFLRHLPDAVAQARAAGAFIDVWSVAGLGRQEVRTTAVLGWLLDARGTHGFGDGVLGSLLDSLTLRGYRGPDRNALAAGYAVTREFCAFGERKNRLDLAIEGREFLLIIEVKIDAPEGPDQLERYIHVAKRKAGTRDWHILYVTHARPMEERDRVTCLRWRDVAHAIHQTVSGHERDAFGVRLAASFADHVQRLH